MIRSFTLPNVFRTIFSLTFIVSLSYIALGQSLTAGNVSGTVRDPNNAVVPTANVTIENAVTSYKQTTTTGTDGTFHFNNVPFNTYVLTTQASGFAAAQQTLNVRSAVPINIDVALAVSGATESVTITTGGADVLENVPSSHTDVD
jgi:Carboxypeptidase regulatory-like domain